MSQEVIHQHQDSEKSQHLSSEGSVSMMPPDFALTAGRGNSDSLNSPSFNSPVQLQTNGGEPIKTPNMSDRHLFSKLNFWKGADKNSYLMQDISQEALQTLYDEALTNSVRDGEVALKNGQRWYVQTATGKFHPVSGPGIVNLTKQEVSFFRTAVSQIKGGKSAEQALLNMKLALNGQGYTMSGGFQTALQRFAGMKGLDVNFVTKNFAQFGAPAHNVPADLKKAANTKFSGKTVRYVKYGGRILVVVAIAADIYNIYTSENKAKAIATTVGGWAGASAGAAAGGAIGAWAAGWGAIPGALIGGAIGYFAGEEVTETVYDWIFEEL